MCMPYMGLEHQTEVFKMDKLHRVIETKLLLIAVSFRFYTENIHSNNITVGRES